MPAKVCERSILPGESIVPRTIRNCILFGYTREVSGVDAVGKIAEEIDFVTRTYPQKLELADEFAPFREVMVNTYCNMIENGSSYWYEVVNS